MTFDVDVVWDSEVEETIPPADVRQAAEAALSAEDVATGAGLTILLTDDEAVADLNRRYLGEDRPTDVLSFAAGPMPEQVESLVAYLGDIAISVPTAQRQAAEKGHATVAEIQLLTVHGVLHLLGYDHLNEDERAAMWTRQAAILSQLGLEAIQPTESEYESED